MGRNPSEEEARREALRRWDMSLTCKHPRTAMIPNTTARGGKGDPVQQIWCVDCDALVRQIR